MRLPWPFGRSRPEPATSGDRAEPSSPPAPPAARAWRDLPPLTETIGPPPLVAPARPFAAALAAKNPPPPILAPLAHARGLDAPRGLIAAAARPAATLAAPSTARPVQRSPLRPRQPAAIEAAPAELVEAVPVIPEPPRRLPIADVATPTPARPLTRSSADALPKPRGVVRSPVAAGGTAAVASSVAQRAPLTPDAPSVDAIRSIPSLAPVSGVTTRAPHAAAAEIAARKTLGQTRRLGLGAPIAGGPVPAGLPLAPMAAARTERSIAVPSGPSMTSRLPESPEALPRLAPAATGAGLPMPTPVSSPAPAPQPALRPSRAQRSPATAPEASPGSAITTPRAAPSQRVAGAAAAEAPLVSARPIAGRTQRAPLMLAPKSAEEPTRLDARPAPGSATPQLEGAGPSNDAAPVKVHRTPAAGEAATALDARAFTHGGEVYLPASHGPLSSGPARSLLAHELTHVVQQRRLGSSLPAEQSPHGGALEAEAVAAERGEALPLAPVARPAPTQAERGASDAFASAQRAPAVPPPAPVRETTGETVMVQPLRAAQRAPMSSGSSTHAEPGPGGKRRQTDQELEDLAQQLYARIGRRLRRDVLVERERAGLAMDLP